MAEKTLNTRILLKYDTYENWTTKNPVLKAGEMAIATIASGNTQEVNSVTAPQVIIKVGNGTSNYNSLPFISGKAADVYPWAKADKKPTYAAGEITGIGDYIAQYVDETLGISVDTDTQYRILKVDDYNYKLQSKAKGEADTAFADVSTITIPKIDAYTKTETDNKITSELNAFISAYITSDGGAIDKLQEIANWIDSDKDGAADIIADVEANTNAIEKLNGADTVEGSVAKKIKDAIAAENLSQYAKDADLATIAKTGNVKDLVQTTGDVLIFNCGNATF